MPNLKPFPDDYDTLAQIPPFDSMEGLQSRRVTIISTIQPETDITQVGNDSFAPIAAIQISPSASKAYSLEVMCRHKNLEPCGAAVPPVAYFTNDSMSRITVAIVNVRNPNPSEEPQNATPPQLEFQIRGTIGSAGVVPGDVRWGGTLLTQNYDALRGLLGKTGGVLVNRWELWGRVLVPAPAVPAIYYGPLNLTISMIVDRLGDVNVNVYGNDVTPVP